VPSVRHDAIDFVLVSESADDDPLKCCICFEILSSPYNLACACMACGGCVDDLLRLGYQNRLCPGCRTPFPAQLQKNAFLQRQIFLRAANCPNKQAGCAWSQPVGEEYRAYKEHVQKCGLRSAKCAACSSVVLLSDAQSHGSTCAGRVVDCPHCLTRMVARDLGGHQSAGEVSRLDPTRRAPCAGTVLCKNGCEHAGRHTVLMKSSADEHLKFVCPLRKEQCPLCHLWVLATASHHHASFCAERLVKCQHCEATMPYSAKQAHDAPAAINIGNVMRAPLCKGLALCPNGCIDDATQNVTQVRPEKSAEHLKFVCPLRKEECPRCRLMVVATAMKHHSTVICANRPVTCPHCSETMPHVHYQSHAAPRTVDIGGVNHTPLCSGFTLCPNGCIDAAAKTVTQLRPDKVQAHAGVCSQRREACRLCQMNLLASQMLHHEKDVCLSRRVACRHCKDEMKFSEVMAHLSKSYRGKKQGKHAELEPPCTNMKFCPNRCMDQPHHLVCLRKSDLAAHKLICPQRPIACPCCTPSVSVPESEMVAHVTAQMLQRPAQMAQLFINQASAIPDLEQSIKDARAHASAQSETAAVKAAKAERAKAEAKIQAEYVKNQTNIARVKENSQKQNRVMFDLVRLYAMEKGYCMNYLAHAKCDRDDCNYKHCYVKDGKWHQRKSEMGSSSSSSLRYARADHEDYVDYADWY
jgi:hypothetical protein